MKKISWISLCLVICVFLASCSSGINQEDHNKVLKQLETEKTNLTETKELLKAATDENAQLKKDNQKLRDQLDEKNELLKEAEPWFTKTEEEKQALIAEQKAAKDAEAEAKRLEAEAEEKQGYDTGITYEQLSRTPDDYKGKKSKFSGYVLQVIEGDGETQLRIATSGRYGDVILVAYDSSIMSSRVLEDDFITIYGVSNGLYTYNSTGGGPISIPLIIVYKIDA